MKNLKKFSLAIAMLICFVSFAQTENAKIAKAITGIVTEKATSLPLPGVRVVIKNSATATQTDMDGKYTITATEGRVLEFTYIGFKTQKVTVGKSNTINVKLEEESSSLDEVVVVGYGTAVEYERSSNYNTSTANGRSKEKVKKGKTIPVTETIQGKISGVQISTVSGQPGSNSQVVIRGVATVNENKSPIYIVDGKPIAETEFKSINQNNIAAINVLKDDAATSLYGNRGSNGVIVVTTANGTYDNMSKAEFDKKLEAIDQSIKTVMSNTIEPLDEDYNSFVENAFESPKSAPLSTFSIDVDNASYTNVRRFINNGQEVPKDAVRVEEMVNFFKYKYPQPTNNEPFSINTEYSECPWNPNNKLVKIGLQGKNIDSDDLPASNLVFLIDVSGSMNQQNKLPLVKESLKILLNELRKKDKVTIVVYAGAAGMVLAPTSGDDKKTITDALDKLQSGGSTAGGEGIKLAYKLAEENFIKNGNNRVILATDGDFNVGASSDSDMQTLIEDKRKSGVFLTCLGYGMGNYKDSKMEILADKGNGNYAYIDNIQEANRFLSKEFKGSMFAIAKDVKIQIEFNPKHVQAYRLIGYENRKLRPEDFTNDVIDAGELGSGHTVTALYEIIPADVKSDFFEETPMLKYSKTTSVADNYNEELATIKFRYKKPDGDKSIEMVKVIENKTISLQNASDDFKFCSAVSWFGLKLRDSKLVKNKATSDIKTLAQQGLSNDSEGYRAEFIRLIDAIKSKV
ncbi:MAG: von Willebrand factor type A domain-containing protein [Flavobacterium sp.]|nr:von Willebrand factor type A domain-containing protein [Flavobacterium sp.]